MQFGAHRAIFLSFECLWKEILIKPSFAEVHIELERVESCLAAKLNYNHPHCLSLTKRSLSLSHFYSCMLGRHVYRACSDAGFRDSCALPERWHYDSARHPQPSGRKPQHVPTGAYGKNSLSKWYRWVVGVVQVRCLCVLKESLQSKRLYLWLLRVTGSIH